MVSKQFFRFQSTHLYNNIMYVIEIYFLKHNDFITRISFNDIINLFQEKIFLVKLNSFNTLIFYHVDILDNKELSSYDTLNYFISPDIYNFDDFIIYIHRLLLEI